MTNIFIIMLIKSAEKIYENNYQNTDECFIIIMYLSKYIKRWKVYEFLSKLWVIFWSFIVNVNLFNNDVY